MALDERMWKIIQKRLGYSDEEMVEFKNDPHLSAGYDKVEYCDLRPKAAALLTSAPISGYVGRSAVRIILDALLLRQTCSGGSKSCRVRPVFDPGWRPFEQPGRNAGGGNVCRNYSPKREVEH